MRLWIWAPVHCSLHHYRSSSPRCGEVDSSPSGLNRPVFVVIGPFLLFQQMKKSYRTFSDIWMDFFFFFFNRTSKLFWRTVISSVRLTFFTVVHYKDQNHSRNAAEMSLRQEDSAAWVTAEFPLPWISRSRCGFDQMVGTATHIQYSILETLKNIHTCVHSVELNTVQGRSGETSVNLHAYILDTWFNKWSTSQVCTHSWQGFTFAAVSRVKLSTAIPSGGKCAK